MSNFKALLVNPETGKREEAEFLDNYFGRNKYGIKFKDGKIYKEDEILNK